MNLIKTKRADSPYSIPTKGSVLPEYDQLVTKRRELAVKRAPLETERRELIERIQSGTDAQPTSSMERQSHALKALGDVPDPIRDDRKRLKAIEDELRTLNDADEILLGRLRDASQRASAIIAEECAPAYKQRVANVLAHLVDAHKANVELDRFAEALSDSDVEWTGVLTPMQPDFLGSPKDGDSALARYFKEAVALGFVKTTAIPTEFSI